MAAAKHQNISIASTYRQTKAQQHGMAGSCNQRKRLIENNGGKISYWRHVKSSSGEIMAWQQHQQHQRVKKKLAKMYRHRQWRHGSMAARHQLK